VINSCAGQQPVKKVAADVRRRRERAELFRKSASVVGYEAEEFFNGLPCYKLIVIV
jgi:hypothetical protein